ncbi:unnamed protein product [Adineta steineri]|uniref:Uncharacterized protein n=1 Tax=Adineta steineri TaxID=433720 RepID=A0A814IV95_9BILA|nr:unnamed protein product [Adineta steineri]CAF3643582.1 unnamed protein product [Adineta steineri]
MPPVKDEKPPVRPLNTSAQIQQIFTEVQLQLPSVNFDNDDDDDSNNNEEILESTIPENTDDLLESLSNNNTNSFLTLHPRIETPQQPPSVESQMRLSPNPLDNSLQNQNSPPKSSFLSMDLFNTIDFDKLPSLISNNDRSQHSTGTRSFHRPRPMNNHPTTTEQQTNVKNRDDRQILERLTQQANKFNINQRSHSTQERDSFREIESALYAASQDRHGKRIGIPESERKTIYIDLRNANVQQQEKLQDEQQSTNPINPSSSQQIQSSESESDDDDDDDDDRNDGMLWFEKRQQAKTQQQPNSTKQ